MKHKQEIDRLEKETRELESENIKLEAHIKSLDAAFKGKEAPVKKRPNLRLAFKITAINIAPNRSIPPNNAIKPVVEQKKQPPVKNEPAPIKNVPAIVNKPIANDVKPDKEESSTKFYKNCILSSSGILYENSEIRIEIGRAHV